MNFFHRFVLFSKNIFKLHLWIFWITIDYIQTNVTIFTHDLENIVLDFSPWGASSCKVCSPPVILFSLNLMHIRYPTHILTYLHFTAAFNIPLTLLLVRGWLKKQAHLLYVLHVYICAVGDTCQSCDHVMRNVNVRTWGPFTCICVNHHWHQTRGQLPPSCVYRECTRHIGGNGQALGTCVQLLQVLNTSNGQQTCLLAKLKNKC